MATLGILQARMSSSRLPGKVLAPVLDVPMIGRQIERLRRASSLDDLVVATSIDSSDDPLCEYLSAIDVKIVRGSLDDVLNRFVTVIKQYQPDTVVRLTADCPLASPSVIDAVITEFHSRSIDYLSNTLQPSFPDGLDVEVVKASALVRAADEFSDSPEREHVTLGVYRRPEIFSVANFAGDSDYSDLRWTVDTPGDLEFVRSIYAQLYPGNPEFDFPEVLTLLAEQPNLSRTTVDGVRNAALEGLDTGAMNG